MADVYDANGGGAPVKREGLVQRHQSKGESIKEAKGAEAGRAAREEGGGERGYADLFRELQGIEARRRGETGLSRVSHDSRNPALPRSVWLTVVNLTFCCVTNLSTSSRKRWVRPNRQTEPGSARLGEALLTWDERKWCELALRRGEGGGGSDHS